MACINIIFIYFGKIDDWDKKLFQLDLIYSCLKTKLYA